MTSQALHHHVNALADILPDPMSTVYALAEKIADDIKKDNP